MFANREINIFVDEEEIMLVMKQADMKFTQHEFHHVLFASFELVANIDNIHYVI